MQPTVFCILPSFFIFCCVWANLFMSVFTAATISPLPFRVRATFPDKFPFSDGRLIEILTFAVLAPTRFYLKRASGNL